MMQSSVQSVVAAVVKRGNEFLVCQRPEHKRHGGLWEFPGGKLEDGESLLQAARRELVEELELNATAAGALLFSVVDQASGFQINFLEVDTEGEPKLNEHMALAWLPSERLKDLALAPSDRSFVDFLNRTE